MKRYALHKPSLPQCGIALLEWIIASLLGVLTLAAAMACLFSSLQMALIQRIPLHMMETAEWLLTRLASEAIQAGEGRLPAVVSHSKLSVRYGLVADALSEGLPSSDQIVFQRRVQAKTMTCDGTQANAGALLVERYFLRPQVRTSTWSLVCNSWLCERAICHSKGAGVALHSALESFQVLYGVRLKPGLSIEYIDANGLKSLPLAPKIHSLRFGLLLSSTEHHSAKSYWSLPAEWLGLRLPSAHGRPQSAWQMTVEVPHG